MSRLSSIYRYYIYVNATVCCRGIEVVHLFSYLCFVGLSSNIILPYYQEGPDSKIGRLDLTASLYIDKPPVKPLLIGNPI